jgi:ATP-binding cassette, subfamily B, vacuolar membrane transporter HMT1/ACLQ
MAASQLQPVLDAAADHAPPNWPYAGPLSHFVTVLQYAYPIVMLCFFLIAFTFRSISASNSSSNITKPTTLGPGGKPLPATDPTRNFVKKTVHDDVTHTQKRVFEWFSLAAAVTFICNSVVIISHSLATTKTENYWAGQSVVVCTYNQGTANALLTLC